MSYLAENVDLIGHHDELFKKCESEETIYSEIMRINKEIAQ